MWARYIVLMMSLSLSGCVSLMVPDLSMPWYLASTGDAEGVQRHLEQGVDPNVPQYNADGVKLPSLFLLAVMNNHIEMARQMLEYGADVNRVDDLELRPLYLTKSPEMLRFLLDAGASIEGGIGLRAVNQMTACLACLQMLIDEGVRIDPEQNRQGMIMAVLMGQLEAAKFLQQHGVSPVGEYQDYNAAAKVMETTTLLHTAAGKGDLTFIGFLIDAGADVNARTSFGETPLQRAVAARSHPAVIALLDAGANPDLGGNGWIPFLLAAYNGDQGIMQLLADRGANVNARTPDGRGAQQLFGERDRLLLQQQHQAQQVAAQRQREEEQDGFQWGKFIAMTTAAAPLAIEGVDSQTQLDVFSGILKDSMPGNQGMSNLEAAADNYSTRNPVPSASNYPASNNAGGIVVESTPSPAAQPAQQATKEAPGLMHCMSIRNAAEGTTGRGAVYHSQVVSVGRVEWNANQGRVQNNFKQDVLAVNPKAIGPNICSFYSNQSQMQNVLEGNRQGYSRHDHVQTAITPRF